MLVLDTFDFWFGTLMLFVLATLQTFLSVCIWGTDNILSELDRGAAIRVPRAVGFVLKYISLPYLVIIFILWAWANLGDRLRGVADNGIICLALGFLFAGTCFFWFVTWLAERRWQKREQKLEKRRQPAAESIVKSEVLK